LAVRRVEASLIGGDFDEAIETLEREDDPATGERTAPIHLAEELLGFNERLGRIGEVALVVVVGSLLTLNGWTLGALLFVPLLFLVIRPVAVWIGLVGSGTEPVQRTLIAWFGVRGIGSLYYLLYAIEHGVSETVAGEMLWVTVTIIAVSILVHGVSVTPLMSRYERWRRGRPWGRNVSAT
jgi:NhaP-type Na+/H+ or K+/H+ antiporter